MNNFEREDLYTSIDLTLRWLAISFLLWALFVYGTRPIDLGTTATVEINVQELDIGQNYVQQLPPPNKEVLYGD